ncbi:putative chaperone protein DNAj [Trypanosoma grayi]|uniref:putative chaperone protein DNAj n=1 Tax=Trypanosoma grayi TaxID=71804 RepID=UPI0004F40142|nr:putative chaperone protein DNAj [Trypanosoma grayi]KEG08006.1 putative chaperone protein DNAj [Trypanosoma grayi]
MHGFYDASNSDYFRQKATHPHGYYSYHQHNRSYTENPFSSSNPFSFHTHMRRAWSMPMGSLLLRGFVMYLGLSVLLLLLYRRYRDWLHDDGWKMAESLARQEQMSEMHRLRQEMNERLRAARDAAAAHNSSVRAYVNRGENNTEYNAVNSSRGHELRALEYARRRQIELSEELKGWPQFGEEKGKLIRRAQDPPGVVFFEPRKEDQLARQMQTMQRGREWSNMKQAAAETSNNNNKNNNSASNGPAVNTAAAAATVAATAGGAPADRDAVSAMNSIFSGVWGGGRRTTPSSSE